MKLKTNLCTFQIMNNVEFSPLIRTAMEAVLKAGDVIAKGFGTDFHKELKVGIQNYVTEYDYAAEKIIIDHLKKSYPTHAFLAEESGSQDGGEVLWIIDPLDGTTNFAHKIPFFSVSVGAQKNNEMICGIIYQPMTKELFVAEKGKGAYLNGQRLRVSQTEVFVGGLGSTAFPKNIHENPLNCIDHFTSILRKGTIIRNMGSTAMNMAYVAAGSFDAYWAVALQPWDLAAAVLLIEEAGGKVTTYKGDKYAILSGFPLVATNGAIHKEVLSYLQL